MPLEFGFERGLSAQDDLQYFLCGSFKVGEQAKFFEQPLIDQMSIVDYGYDVAPLYERIEQVSVELVEQAHTAAVVGVQAQLDAEVFEQFVETEPRVEHAYNLGLALELVGDALQERRLAGSLVTHESDKALARPYSVQQRSHRLTGVGAIKATLVLPIAAERLRVHIKNSVVHTPGLPGLAHVRAKYP